MFKRHVLAALATGIPTQDEDAARAALARIDRVARGGAKRRFERSLIDAALACDAAQLPSPPPVHVMRLAALAVAGQPADAADQAAVASAYAALPAVTMPRFPLYTLVALLVTASMIGGIALYVATRPGPPPRTYVRSLPPPSADAFTAGGTPLHDPAIGKLLGDELTDLVVQANRVGGNDREKLLKTLRTPEPILAKGKPLAKAWDAMLDAFGAALDAKDRVFTQRDADSIREAGIELSEAFVAAGLGYHIEARFRSGHPIIQAYFVEQVVFVTTNGTPRRVLSLRRLDNLNTTWAVLGMHTEDSDPQLHLDRIDVNVASFVLPVLAGGQPYPLADTEWMLWPNNKQTASAIGDAVRREYVAALANDAVKAQKSAALLVKRGDIIDEWRDKLGRKDIYFIQTDQLFVPPSLLESLSSTIPKYQLEKVAALDAQLAALEAPRLHARLHDLVAATVRRHEAQHGFDYDRDTELRYPEALDKLLGSPHTTEGEERPVVSSARAELSAYLSQIVNDPVTPQASLWHLARNVFNKTEWGTGEFYAGVVVLEGLAKQFGADVTTPRYARGLDRDRMSAFAMLVAQQPADKLHTAAVALWTELFGEPPTAILDTPPRPQLAQH